MCVCVCVCVSHYQLFFIQSLKDKLSYARNALATTSSISCSELAEERSRLVAQLEATQAEVSFTRLGSEL